MDLKDAYYQVAERSVLAAATLLDDKIQEGAAFHAYHAFESAGGALCEARETRYPRSHHQKLNSFKAAAHHLGIGVSVATVAIIVGSIRNQCLYPETDPLGSYQTPNQHITLTAARDIVKRV